MAEIETLVDVPLLSGQGRRLVGIDDAGTYHLGHFRAAGEEAVVLASFTVASAQRLARDVIAGHERIGTASTTLLTVAAALLVIEVVDGEPAAVEAP